MADQIIINFTVVTDDPDQAVKVTELLGRTATGMALDGMSACLHINTATVEEIEQQHE